MSEQNHTLSSIDAIGLSTLEVANGGIAASSYSGCIIGDNGNQGTSAISINNASPSLIGQFVFPDHSGGELLRITDKAFIFKGVEIEDAGAAYAAFMEVMDQQKNHQAYRKAGSRRHIHLDLSPEDSTPAQLMASLVPTANGCVLIRKHLDNWVESFATEKEIYATMRDVRLYFAEQAPEPYTEEQLNSIRVVSNIGGRWGVGYVALMNDAIIGYLTGPVKD